MTNEDTDRGEDEMVAEAEVAYQEAMEARDAAGEPMVSFEAWMASFPKPAAPVVTLGSDADDICF